ncbi:MAG: hypothetical protein A2942_03315 [Candidatus Lloydbacteria bacterium RIFCSPLOWO2_01_FULL_50_20]|uniref:Uncharacterized protein n=1 Tax=Candidatus Lloydbacteria bacterium RIFCSPLOWO2_01_FULL_50_20 TaxID=1798665 RepID=A0A1G2DHJ4_9BACT|nr:MAG: hypothetical protein A3C13_03900 [Candidatus Lloydbacteria bacterium RIFCSPHIGHO2_02_FULL_50_11]OGZ12983.1 MAG: hypothetical protein A2942_03315 [Candidatus Lloydbacteria bacterium RIFCSPLOWO2_01_FULL_50_20]
MRPESLGLSSAREEKDAQYLEGEELNISDGMDPIFVPEKITKENFHSLFGDKLPEQISPDMFNDGGELKLEQE